MRSTVGLASISLDCASGCADLERGLVSVVFESGLLVEEELMGLSARDCGLLSSRGTFPLEVGLSQSVRPPLRLRFPDVEEPDFFAFKRSAASATLPSQSTSVDRIVGASGMLRSSKLVTSATLISVSSFMARVK